MRAFSRVRTLVWMAAATFFCVSGFSARLLADDGKDDKDKAAAAAKSTAKSDPATAGLTERERMLLDRVEQLEKRVAELEAKGDPATAATSTAEAAASANARPNAASAFVPVWMGLSRWAALAERRDCGCRT